MEFNWDDARIFLEVYRTGRLNRAAKRLRVSHTTVARRIRAMEESFGAALFDYGQDGLTLSDFGTQILPYAQDMESAATGLSDKAARMAGRSKARVRIGAPDGIGNAVLSHILPRLMSEECGVEIELVPVPVTHKLWRRDVDIAISLDRPETGRLVMRKLTDYELRLYAGPEFFVNRPRPQSPEDLAEYPFVGYVDELLYTPELDFNRIIRPGLNIVYRGATVKAQFDAVRGNVGLGVLPCFMTEGSDLEPLLPNDVTFSRTYWLLYPEDYRELDHIKRVSQFIFDAIRDMGDRFKYRPRMTQSRG